MAARAELERQRRLLRELATNSGELSSPLSRFMQSLAVKSMGRTVSTAVSGENSNGQPSLGLQPNSLDLLTGTKSATHNHDSNLPGGLNAPANGGTEGRFATTAAGVSDYDTSYEEPSCPVRPARSRTPRRNMKPLKRRVRSANTPRRKHAISTPPSSTFRSPFRPPPPQDDQKVLQITNMKLQTEIEQLKKEAQQLRLRAATNTRTMTSFRTKLSETLAKLTATEGLLAATEAENKKLRSQVASLRAAQKANAQPVSDTVNLDSDDSVHHVAEGRVATRSNSQIDEICRKLRNSEISRKMLTRKLRGAEAALQVARTQAEEAERKLLSYLLAMAAESRKDTASQDVLSGITREGDDSHTLPAGASMPPNPDGLLSLMSLLSK